MRFLGLVLFLGCATVPPAPCKPGDALVNATLWTQSAAEYRASALQTYAAARVALDAGLAAPSSTLPPAIILDLDETALDNTGYAARSIRANTTFKFDEKWSAWVKEAASRAVPGATDFVTYAASRGVAIFYITNRTADMEADTRRNLESLGFPVAEAGLLLRSDTTNKTTRRDSVTARYDVLLYLGDDLSDFTNASGKSVEERNAIAASNAGAWGTRWFVVPNPMYGSWEGAGTPCGI